MKGVNAKLNLLSEQAVGKKTDNANACPESSESIVMDAQEIGCWLSMILGLWYDKIYCLSYPISLVNY